MTWSMVGIETPEVIFCYKQNGSVIHGDVLCHCFADEFVELVHGEHCCFFPLVFLVFSIIQTPYLFVKDGSSSLGCGDENNCC